MSAAIYSRLLAEFQRGFHESTDARASVEIRSPGSFHRGWEPSELDTVNYETEAVIASVAVPYSADNDASTHAVAVTTREYWRPPELLERFKQSCSEAGAILPLAIRSRLALDWEISRNPIACWMSLLTWLHGFTVRDPDGRYLEHQLITNPWQASADAIEYLRLNTDSPGWPDEAEPVSAGGDASAGDESAVFKLQAFAIALRLVGEKTTAIDAALRPIITEQQSEIDRLKADYRDVVQRIESDWEAEFGEPYPKDIDDWYRWAWRAGFPSERILKGDWKLSELFPCIEGYLLKLRDQHGSAEAQTTGQDGPAEAAGDRPAPTKAKRSTERGEGRAKLIAALTKHHKYADGGCLNLEPIGNNELARLVGVDQATASAFFKQQFKGHGKYKAACADAARLAVALKLLNGEFAPHLLYGSKPPGEDERDED
ncbi:MAG: hypothetical protein IT425_15110 [Pirellulales bacterium]|nr:hypothetical protein [Pirellulales bacterium]